MLTPKGWIELIRLYILDKDYAGNTPLHWACHTTAENAINFLLSWMDDVNLQDKKGQTPLHVAIHTFRPKIVKKLLFMGADVNLKNNSGQSVLNIVSVNRNQIPDYENILHIITILSLVRVMTSTLSDVRS